MRMKLWTTLAILMLSPSAALCGTSADAFYSGSGFLEQVPGAVFYSPANSYISVLTEATPNILFYNIGLGTSSAPFTIGRENFVFGRDNLTGNTTGDNDLAIGSQTLGSNTTGQYNIGVGNFAMLDNTIGANNTAVGWAALELNTSGSANLAFGNNALQHNTTGSDNTGIGYYAGQKNTTGSNNMALGFSALQENVTGSLNTAIGEAALEYNQTGNGSVAIGALALGGTASPVPTFFYDVCVGFECGEDTTSGSHNAGVGMNAIQHLTTGNENIALGEAAGASITGGGSGNTTSTNSVYLGYQTRALADGDTNEIVIGDEVTGAGNNSVVLGNGSIVKTVLRGVIYSGATAGVSCSAGQVSLSTMVVTNGIVTHC
jgi:hypothetical protein